MFQKLPSKVFLLVRPIANPSFNVSYTIKHLHYIVQNFLSNRFKTMSSSIAHILSKTAGFVGPFCRRLRKLKSAVDRGVSIFKTFLPPRPT